MIQRTQDTDGGWKGGGWAPVLQSALANNALESARDAGLSSVDDKVLDRSRNYQKVIAMQKPMQPLQAKRPVYYCIQYLVLQGPVQSAISGDLL